MSDLTLPLSALIVAISIAAGVILWTWTSVWVGERWGWKVGLLWFVCIGYVVTILILSLCS